MKLSAQELSILMPWLGTESSLSPRLQFWWYCFCHSAISAICADCKVVKAYHLCHHNDNCWESLKVCCLPVLLFSFYGFSKFNWNSGSNAYCVNVAMHSKWQGYTVDDILQVLTIEPFLMTIFKLGNYWIIFLFGLGDFAFYLANCIYFPKVVFALIV